MKKTTFLTPFLRKKTAIKRLSMVCCLFFLLLGETMSAQSYITLGTQIQQSGTEDTSPVNGYFSGRKIQIVYSAAELLAAGAGAGNIQRLAWDVTVANDAEDGFPNYTIKMGHIATTGISGSNFVTNLTQVKSAFNYMPVTGFNDIVFDTPFNWNGIDNIVVDICFDGVYFSDSELFGKLWNYNGATNSYIHSESDIVVLCNTLVTNGALAKKPRVRFFMQQPSCLSPTGLSSSAITKNTATINWTGSTSNPVNGYSYYKSEVNVAPLSNATPSGTVQAGVTVSNISGLFPDTLYYVWVKSNCSTGVSSNWIGPIVFRTACDANDIISTTPGTRCGSGTVTLEAASNGGTVKWYDTVTGGIALAAGTTFITPPISATKTYYAAAEAMAGSGIIGTATTLSDAINIQPTAFANRWTNYKSQIIYTAAELIAAGVTQGNLTSIGFNIATLGSSAVNEDYTVKIATTIGNTFTNTTFLTTGFTTVYGPATYIHTNSGWQIINFTTPYFWDGTSNIVVEISHKGAQAYENAQTYYTQTTGNNTVLFDISNIGVTGELSTLRPNIIFGGCSSVRVPVPATVDASPLVTLSTENVVICSGEEVVVTLINGGADYDTYVWTPAVGVSGNALTGWTFNPEVTTVYTLNASQSLGAKCSANPVQVTITVNPLPSAIITTPEVKVCPGSVEALIAGGGMVTEQLLSDTFDIISSQFGTQDFVGTSSVALNTTYSSEGAGSVLFRATSNNADVSYSTNTDINLAEYTTAQLTFSHIAALQSHVKSRDLGYVQYSTDSGTTWTTFPTSSYVGAGTLITTQGDDVPVDGVVFSTKSYIDWVAKFTGDTSIPDSPSLWKTETINIPIAALTNDFRIRFRYTSDFNLLFYGWLIDDLKITGTKSNLVWSPVTDLYSDPEATMPYTGQSLETVYVKSDVSRIYTITASSLAGCTVTALVDLDVKAIAAPILLAPSQAFCNSGTVAELITDSGTAIKWYSNSAGGMVLDPETILEHNVTYYASQTIDGCEGILRTPLVVNINAIPSPPQGETNQTITVDDVTTATIEDLKVVLETNGIVTWYKNEDDAINNEYPLAASTQLIDGEDYFGTQTIGMCRSTEVIAVTVGIVLEKDTFIKEAFKYHPNPVIDVLNLSSTREINSVTVFNLLGQEISNDKPNTSEVKIDMTSFAEGVYLINVIAGNAVKTIKVIKK